MGEGISCCDTNKMSHTFTSPRVPTISGAKKHNFKTPLEGSVFKATQSTTEYPPKTKHIRGILQCRDFGSCLLTEKLLSMPRTRLVLMRFSLSCFRDLLRRRKWFSSRLCSSFTPSCEKEMRTYVRFFFILDSLLEHQRSLQSTPFVKIAAQSD